MLQYWHGHAYIAISLQNKFNIQMISTKIQCRKKLLFCEQNNGLHKYAVWMNESRIILKMQILHQSYHIFPSCILLLCVSTNDEQKRLSCNDFNWSSILCFFFGENATHIYTAVTKYNIQRPQKRKVFIIELSK